MFCADTTQPDTIWHMRYKALCLCEAITGSRKNRHNVEEMPFTYTAISRKQNDARKEVTRAAASFLETLLSVSVHLLLPPHRKKNSQI